MNFPNPFKKKEDKEFKLNQDELPSLGQNDDFNTSSNNSLSNNNMFNTSAFPASQPTSEYDSSSSQGFESSLSSNNLNSTEVSEDLNNSFSQSNAPQTDAFSLQPVSSSSIPQNSSSSDSAVSVHHDLNRSQMETTIAKITLLEAKLSSIEQKLDVVLKVLAEEVSEETQRKIKVKHMMDTIKNS